MTQGADSSPHLWTATQTAARIAAGAVSAKAVAEDCLAWIAQRDPALKAWRHVVSPEAIPTPAPGPLHGVPIAVKDMIDTRDMPTTYNSPLYDGHQPAADAACVEILRAAGAIILGKTDTTEFAAAGRDAATGNPHDLARTPGGSSAGSAAAVADFHVPLALATQTGGSTIRPGSFCGVYAFKPTWGLVSREGAKVYAISLDTIGWYARSIADLALMGEVFAIQDPQPDVGPGSPLRIAVCRSPVWSWAEAGTIEAMAAAAEALSAAGAEVVDLDLPPLFDGMAQAHKVILHREGGAAFRSLQRARGAELHDDFHHRAENRHGFTDQQLRDAYDLAAQGRMAFDALAEPFDAVLTPSAPGVAPLGRGPGDPIFNQMWTLLHTPCANLPHFRGDHGLPVGVTLTGPRFSDRRLLKAASVIEQILATAGHTPACAAPPER